MRRDERGGGTSSRPGGGGGSFQKRKKSRPRTSRKGKGGRKSPSENHSAEIMGEKKPALKERRGKGPHLQKEGRRGENNCTLQQKKKRKKGEFN